MRTLARPPQLAGLSKSLPACGAKNPSELSQAGRRRRRRLAAAPVFPIAPRTREGPPRAAASRPGTGAGSRGGGRPILQLVESRILDHAGPGVGAADGGGIARAVRMRAPRPCPVPRPLPRPGLVPASSRPRPGLVPASFRPRPGLVPASFRPRSGLVPASFRPRPGLVPAPLPGSPRPSPRTSGPHAGTAASPLARSGVGGEARRPLPSASSPVRASPQPQCYIF